MVREVHYIILYTISGFVCDWCVTIIRVPSKQININNNNNNNNIMRTYIGIMNNKCRKP